MREFIKTFVVAGQRIDFTRWGGIQTPLRKKGLEGIADVTGDATTTLTTTGVAIST
jgi:hypothetical protein